jgi:hypothetical protein
VVHLVHGTEAGHSRLSRGTRSPHLEPAGPAGAGWRSGIVIGLHLGAHKTASTHLQRTIAAHRVQIEAQGMTYLGPAELRGNGLRLGWVAAGGADAQSAARRVGKEIARRPRLLISEENILGTAHEPEMLLQGRFYPEGGLRLSRVLDALGRDGPSEMLYLAVRDPADFLVSAYGQRLLGGTIEPFGAYLQGCDPAALRWSELVGRLCAVAGVSGCTIWRYEDWPAVAPGVLAAMLPETLAATINVAPAVSNPGLSQRAQRWVLRRHARGEASAETARVARRKFPKSATEPAFQPLGEDTRARSAAAYSRDIAALARIPGVSLITP